LPGRPALPVLGWRGAVRGCRRSRALFVRQPGVTRLIRDKLPARPRWQILAPPQVWRCAMH
jgi:hypothetical protein